MFNLPIEWIWGVPVAFDVKEKRLYMVYYGIYIKSVFIGVAFLSNNQNLKRKLGRESVLVVT